jgi:HD superfamily phosphohydrolase
LEHSIGALFLAQRLSVAAHLTEQVPENYVRAIRVAALCHDVGHGVMSHVAENSLAYIEEAEQLRNEFTEVEKREAQLGEINSFFIIGWPAFSELLDVAQQKAGEMVGVSNLPLFLQRCIIGRPVDPQYPLLHQLVSINAKYRYGLGTPPYDFERDSCRLSH